MKALRLVINQSSANYKKEETVDNKMTYPLPPVSTIIGAIHNACGYREYKDMDISIQGNYSSMHREPYTDYCFLNSLQDDRGILVKMSNCNMLSNSFEKVAYAPKKNESNLLTGKSIIIYQDELLKEYVKLKNLRKDIDKYNKEKIMPFYDLIKKRKQSLTLKKKKVDNKSEEYERIANREKEIRALEQYVKDRFAKFRNDNYTVPISKYRSLTTSLKYYEILDDVRLIIHISAKEEILNNILENIYNLKSIGRSEDFVDIENAEMVELCDKCNDEVESNYSAYIDYKLVDDEIVQPRIKGTTFSGTRYYLNKKYEIVKGKRVFEKKKVVYLSNYVADELGDGLYMDEYNGEKLLVNFL